MAKKRGARISPIITNDNVEKVLIENFVALQRVMTNLAGKFDSLTIQISKLLELFELSAKSLAEKSYAVGDKRMTEKLDSLLGQNKLIAKGLVLLHEKGNPTPQAIPQIQPKMPGTQQMTPMRFHPPVRRLEERQETTGQIQSPQPKIEEGV